MHSSQRLALAAWGVLIASAGVFNAYAQRPDVRVPDSSDAVVAELPPGYVDVMPLAADGASTGVEDPLLRARRLLDAAASTGDSRLMTRADTLLAGLGEKRSDSNDALLMRAYSAQHKHDFDVAMTHLGTLLERDPRSSRTRLMRAGIHLVQGRIKAARSDCAVLALGVDASAGQLCIASLALRMGDLEQSARILDGWLRQGANDPFFWHALVMRATVADRAGDDAQAGRLFARALRLAPGDVRTLMPFSRYMRRIGRGRELERVLSQLQLSDGLHLQRALAAHAADLPDAGALAQAQSRRYAHTRAASVLPELRDEAEYWLVLRGRPERALDLALANFAEQRDHEDVVILMRAAEAAGRPQALMPLRGWARTQGIVLPGGAD